ncbi:MAG TPA: Stp1/IreP family PP2C-type Ser/Thr phosphatase [Solirubrobacteraceae bacterium]|nr:Stp1/IreP family PP2C-type Ser/Thr phosphatase [Solirubrobacteraceae bacterium]
MLRVCEQYTGTDTGLQRRANEDSLLARSPLFVVADGMGGAQAGEVASRLAVDSFRDGLGDPESPERELAEHALRANNRIHELSQSNAEQAGMGTTLTAVYVGPEEIAIAHVGDSRAYCLREGELLRLTDDHSLVDEMIREGRLTPEEAEEHPQRSIITRALGPEETVEVDTRSFRARAGDVYLLCSDGLTSMVPEPRLAEILRAQPRLRDAGEALIREANRAGGRDNITVILLRLEEVHVPGSEQVDRDATLTGVPAVSPAGATAALAVRAPEAVPARLPRRPAVGVATPTRRRRLRGALPLAVVVGVLAVVLAAAYVAMQSVYFLAANGRGLVTMYQGVPYELPGGIRLYSSYYVSGVSASSLGPRRREELLAHTLRSEGSAGSLIRDIEREDLSE